MPMEWIYSVTRHGQGLAWCWKPAEGTRYKTRPFQLKYSCNSNAKYFTLVVQSYTLTALILLSKEEVVEEFRRQKIEEWSD